MSIVSISAIIVGVLFFVGIISKNGVIFTPVFTRKFFWSFFVMVGVVLLYSSLQQYRAWSVGAPGLLPPHTPITYFLYYVGFRIWVPYIISLVVAFLWLGGMKILNKKYHERFFYNDEFLSAPLALFLVGYPGVLVYILAFFCVFILGSLIQTIRGGENQRFSMQFLWIPIALCVILINELYLNHSLFWGVLKM